MPGFADHVARANARVDAAFGERVEVRPRIERPRIGFAADPGRGVGIVKGDFHVVSGEQDLDGARTGTGSSLSGFSQVAIGAATLALSAHAIATLGYRPQKGDRISLLDRSPVLHFAVAVSSIDEMSDLLLSLTAEAT